MTEKTPKASPAAKPAKPSTDEAFDDVLFSASAEAAIVSSAESAETFHFDDAFEDVLFGGPTAVEASEPEAQKPVAEESEFSDDDLYFVEEAKSSSPPVTPASEVPLAKSAPQQQRPPQAATINAGKPAVREVNKVAAADIPVLGEVKDALFASDDALDAALEKRSAPARAKNNPVETENYNDALFNSDEALRQSLDVSDGDSHNRPAKADSAAASDEYADALFARDDAMIAASDNSTQIKSAIAAPVKQAAINTEKPVTTFDYRQLLTELSKSPELTQNSSAPIAPRLLNRAINGVRSLSLFDEREVDEAAFAEFKRQRLAAKEAAKAVPVPANVKDKAKLLFSKARGNVDEMIGASLPARELPLDFKFVLQRPKKDIDGLMSRREIAQLLEKKGATVHNLMRRMDKQLLLLSRSEQSDAERLQILQLLRPSIIEHTLAMHKRFCKNPLQASDIEYSNTAMLCVDVLKNAITGYRQLFAAIYESNNFNYNRQREFFIELAFELLELLLLEQQYLAVIQYAPSNISIRSVNKIFAVLSSYEPDSAQLRFDSVLSTKKCSFADVYTRYQLMLCFDHCALNPKFAQVLLDYLDEHSDFVAVLQPEELAYSSSSQFLHVSDVLESRPVYCTEAVTTENAELATWQSYLSVLDFFNRIKNDFKQCYGLLSGERSEHSDAVLQQLGLPAALSVCSFINSSVAQLQSNQKIPQYRLYSAAAMELRSGFLPCRDAIAQSHVDDDSPTKSNKPVLPRVGVWSVSFRDEQAVYLQAEVASKLPLLCIGDLLLLREGVDGELQQHLLRLVRVERSVNNLLSVILHPVANEAAEVNLAADVPEAILALHGDEHLLLRTAVAKPRSDEVIEARFADEAAYFLHLDQLQFMNEYYQQFSLR